MSPPADGGGAPLLEVRGVEGGYGEYRVLEGVSLRLERGETLALLGPNGHGKTTLVRMISGLLRPSRGEIRFAGRPIHGLPASQIVQLGIAQIPQGDLVFPRMLVEENLLAGAFLHWRDRRRRIDEVLALFPRLRERLQVPARVLSGGERRMLALARGLLISPTLLIVDEPSLGLAPIVRESVYKALAGIVESGIAMLLIEEKASHLHALADRICVMERGRIVVEGAAAELLADRDRLMKAYLG